MKKLPEITKNQHIYPTAILKRFTGTTGMVSSYLVGHRKHLDLKPDAKPFCSKKRVWDQRAEAGWMKQIEDEFSQELSQTVDKGLPITTGIATRFYYLWKLKSYFQSEDQQLYGTAGESLTNKEQKTLEQKHLYYVNEDGTLEARFFASVRMQLELDWLVENRRIESWGVLTAEQVDFVFPLSAPPEYPIIPLGPRLLLLGNVANQRLLSHSVKNVNIEMTKHEMKLLFSGSRSQLEKHVGN